MLALGNASARRVAANEDDATTPPKLPRPSTFRGRDKLELASASLSTTGATLETAARQLQQLAPWSTHLLPAAVEPPTFQTDELLTHDPQTMAHRARLLRQRYGLGRTASDSSKAAHLARAACDQLVLDSTLASWLYSPRTILPTDPPPGAQVNAPFPPELEPPPLQFSYFRPRAKATRAETPGTTQGLDEGEQEEEEDEHDWRRANLKSVGVRMLLSEWHVGSDPDEYAWNNPYANEPVSAQTQSQSQTQGVKGKGKRALGKKDSGSGSGVGFGASQAPPAFQPSQGPAPPSFQFSQAPPTFQGARPLGTVREEGGARFGGGAGAGGGGFSASQPVAGGGGGGEEGGTQAVGAATQVVPGAWGGRVGKEKKKGKKRVSGF